MSQAVSGADRSRMRRARLLPVAIGGLLWLAGVALLWLGDGSVTGTLATIALCVLAPGTLVAGLVAARAPGPRPTPLEMAVYSVASGFALFVVVMLLLSYLPGGLGGQGILLAFALLSLLLALLVFRSGDSPAQMEAVFADAVAGQSERRWAIAALLVIMLAGGALRFANLGYAEFHGDEARAVLRAAAVLQGYEDTLFVHRKGPGEILTAAAPFALAGVINEAGARLPLAIASVAALGAIFLLGWRMFGLTAAASAAALMAVDGYLVAFAHFVQYQSIVVLLVTTAVLIAYRVYVTGAGIRAYGLLAALVVAAGLLYHYDALLVFVPLAVLLATMLLRRRVPAGHLLRELWPALLLGLGLTLLYYGPLAVHPSGGAAFSYVVEGRLEGGEGYALHNNIGDIFLRTSVYSSVWYLGFLVAGAVFAALAAYRRAGLPTLALAAIALVATGLVMALFLSPDLLVLSGVNVTPWIMAALVIPIWLLPGQRDEQRTVWLWFGMPMLAAFFLIATPRTHVHIIFLPWALIVGDLIAGASRRLRGWTGERVLQVAGPALALALMALFGNYVYQVIVRSNPEVWMTWEENRPRAYWTPANLQRVDSIYGLPINNGWKVAASLYQQGIIQGDYDTSVRNDWVTAWYFRDAHRCWSTASWYFDAWRLDKWVENPEQAADRVRSEGFLPWASATVDGVPRLRIYAREGVPAGPLPASLSLDDYTAAFDRTATPDFALSYPVIDPDPQHKMDVRFEQGIRLEGIDFDTSAPVIPGQAVNVALYWRGDSTPANSYKVTLQSYSADGIFVAQQDSIPVCDRRHTNHWIPGERIVDAHELVINPGVPPGTYPLYVALYREDTGERLPVIGADGSPIDDKAQIGELVVK